MKQTTIAFLFRGSKIGEDRQICLAMKKRGHGEGNWNGAGGKLEQGESYEAAMVREVQEELCVTPITWTEVATIKFPGEKPLILKVYFVDSFEGEPIETEEMRPQWFNIEDIPYQQMWDSDKVWLEAALEGGYINGVFEYEGGKVVREELTRSLLNKA